MTTALEDFHVRIGESVKVYPFLFQRNSLISGNTGTHLDVGKSVDGVVYFEQGDSWGGCYPRILNGYSTVMVAVRDIFGHKHCRKFQIPLASLEEAQKYNPSFGATLRTFHSAGSEADVK